MPPTRRQPIRTRRVVTKQGANTALIAGGIGVGVLLLIIVIAVAASGGGEKNSAPPEEKSEAPVPDETPGLENTGPIMFICSNSSKHPDQEQIIPNCPKCGSRDRFFNVPDGFVCHHCKEKVLNADLKCPDCGVTPRRPRIKHR